MIYTFDALRRQVLRQLDEENDAPTTAQLAGDYLNQAHQMRVLANAGYFLLHPKEVTFQTTPGVRGYTLHPMVNTILYLRNDSEGILMRELPNRGLSTGAFDWKAEEGSASEFLFWGHSQVAAQPPTPGLVNAVSSSGSDTGGNYEVVVKGMTASGDIVAEKLVLTGTAPVYGSYAFDQILTVTKNGEFNGILTVTVGTTQILVLNPLEMGKQYRQIYLVQNPVTPETLSYRFYRKPLIMINDYDVPEIPAPYSQLLVWDALLLFAGYNTDIRQESVLSWRQQQEQWAQAFEQYLRDVSTVGSQPLFVQDKEGAWNSTMPSFGN